MFKNRLIIIYNYSRNLLKFILIILSYFQELFKIICNILKKFLFFFKKLHIILNLKKKLFWISHYKFAWSESLIIKIDHSTKQNWNYYKIEISEKSL